MHTIVHSSVIHYIPEKQRQVQKSVSQWINYQTVVYHTMKYYSAVKKKEWNRYLLQLAATWKNLENCMQSKGSQSQRTIYCRIPLVWNVQNKYSNKNLQLTASTLVVVVDWASKEEWWGDGSGYVIYFEDDENVLKLVVVMVVKLVDILKTIGLHTLNSWLVCEL